MKKRQKITIVVIVSILALAIIKDQAIKLVVSTAATQITGAKVSIRNMSVGIIRQSIRIHGFRMYNPQGFPRGILIDLPKIVVNYDLAAILKGKLHLSFVEINLKEMGMIINKEGKLNVDSLEIVQQQEKEKEEAKKPAKQMAMQIDKLNLKIGRIVSKDYSKGKEPVILVYDMNMDKAYKNITSPVQLAALIISEPMKQAGIKGAAIYGVALLSGVGIIPVAIISTFAEKDHTEKELNRSIESLYNDSLLTLKRIGKVNSENKQDGTIEAEVYGAGVSVNLKPLPNRKNKITVTARRLLMPRPEVACGVLYQIIEE